MDPTPREKIVCKYPGCENWFYADVPKDERNKQFFSFPKDPIRLRMWWFLCKVDCVVKPPPPVRYKYKFYLNRAYQNRKVVTPQTTNWRLCEDHFTDSSFSDETKMSLICTAMPISADKTRIVINRSSLPCKCYPPCFESPSLKTDTISNDDLDDFFEDHDYCSSLESKEVKLEKLKKLQSKVRNMWTEERFCCLLFDEIPLPSELHYIRAKKLICGLDSEESSSQSNPPANRVAAFMVRAIRGKWKQIVAYYFTMEALTPQKLQFLIKKVLSQLQRTGLKVVATVCRLNPTNCQALKSLSEEEHPQPSLSNRPIVAIFDVRDLLKSTRNCLVNNIIQFESDKRAKIAHVRTLFDYSQSVEHGFFYMLKPEHFNVNDPSVEGAAGIFSQTAGAYINLFVRVAKLPPDAMDTAEFCVKIEKLYHSLSSSNRVAEHYSPFRCVLKQKAPHLEFWLKLVEEMNSWKVIDLESGADVTHEYDFISGWQTTMKSVMLMWTILKDVVGFRHLSTKALTLEPLETLLTRVSRNEEDNPEFDYESDSEWEDNM